jgi:protein arginine N-methyltransferase 5
MERNQTRHHPILFFSIIVHDLCLYLRHLCCFHVHHERVYTEKNIMSDFFIGLRKRDPSDAFHVAVNAAGEAGFNVTLLNITRPTAERFLFQDELLWREQDAWRLHQVFEPEDLYVNVPSSQVASVWANASSWLDFDADNMEIVNNSCLAWRQELSWCAHIGIHVAFMDLPKTPTGVLCVARCLNQLLEELPYLVVVVRVPLTPLEENAEYKAWNTLYASCAVNERLKLSLILNADLPDTLEWQRWLAEPVHSITISTEAFLTNRSGYPVISKAHQQFLHRFMKHGAGLILSDDTNATRLDLYAEYLGQLHTSLPAPEAVDELAEGYHDVLQSPLQPLMHNLDASTYHIFQLDPVKYVMYEKAVYQALVDSKPFWDEDYVPVIMVVGAGGHGPLVNCCIQAAAAANVHCKLYAIEKNPNAIITLKRMKETVWHDTVQLVHTDMRHWDNPEKADILVSELLGSFGDNELSPECLDGAQRLLKTNGISIPESYSAYVAPLSSYKLHTEVKRYKELKSYETPYVVMFKAVHELTDAQLAWTFTHPLRDVHGRIQPPPPHNMHNWRFTHNIFSIDQGEMCHGFAGYFDTVLYKDILLSIEPKTFSKGMFSWFPIYFPLHVPVFLPAGCQVGVTVWRLSDTKKVWYEWSLQVTHSGQIIYTSAIHNPQGRSSWIGL